MKLYQLLLIVIQLKYPKYAAIQVAILTYLTKLKTKNFPLNIT